MSKNKERKRKIRQKKTNIKKEKDSSTTIQRPIPQPHPLDNIHFYLPIHPPEHRPWHNTLQHLLERVGGRGDPGDWPQGARGGGGRRRHEQTFITEHALQTGTHAICPETDSHAICCRALWEGCRTWGSCCGVWAGGSKVPILLGAVGEEHVLCGSCLSARLVSPF